MASDLEGKIMIWKKWEDISRGNRCMAGRWEPERAVLSTNW